LAQKCHLTSFNQLKCLKILSSVIYMEKMFIGLGPGGNPIKIFQRKFMLR